MIATRNDFEVLCFPVMQSTWVHTGFNTMHIFSKEFDRLCSVAFVVDVDFSWHRPNLLANQAHVLEGDYFFLFLSVSSTKLYLN